MPYTRKKRKAKDSFSTKPNATLYLGYVDDNESVEEIMKKFQVLDEIEQNKKKELSMSGENNQTEQVELSDKDLEEIFHKTSSYAIEAVIDNSYFSDEFYSDEYSEDDDDDEWSIKYSYGTQDSYSHRSLSRYIEPNSLSSDNPSWKDVLKDIASQALAVNCYSVDEQNQLHPFENVLFPDEISVVKVPKEIPQTWYTPIRPYSSHEPLPAPLSITKTVTDVLKFNYTSFHQVFEGILINPPWDRITPSDLASLSLPSTVIPTGMIFIWVDKKYIGDVLTIMERKNFFYVENVNWAFKEPNNYFISNDSDTYLRSGKRTMLLFRRGKRKNVTGPVELIPLQLRHQRTADAYVGSIPQKQYQQYSHGYEFIYNLIETLLYEANYNETTQQGRFLELWGQKGYTRKGWTIVSEE